MPEEIETLELSEAELLEMKVNAPPAPLLAVEGKYSSDISNNHKVDFLINRRADSVNQIGIANLQKNRITSAKG